MTTSDYDRLLDLYGYMREEIISIEKTDNTRFTQGLSLIVAVIGYPLLSQSDKWLVAFSPFVLVIIGLQHIRSRNSMATLANHISKIEEEVSEEGSLFRWESQRGGYANILQGDSEDHSRRFPGYILLILLSISYLTLCVLSIHMWPANPPIFRFINKNYLWIIYGALTAIILLSVKLHYNYITDL